MGFIYKITNLINNKVYIGKTALTIEQRFYQHKIDSKKEKYKNKYLYRAFKKYGIDNFVIEEIEECSNELLNQEEIKFIKLYNSYYSGYNETFGGDGVVRLDYKKIYELWEKGLRPIEIAKKMKKDGDVNKIRNVLCAKYGEDYISKEILKRYNNATLKKIECFDKNTNDFIKNFNSLKEGAIWVWKQGYTKGSVANAASFIGKCCKGIKPSAYGFKWKFIE